MLTEEIFKIRSFNRFYTKTAGLVDRYFLDSPYSLAQLRVLYEIRSIEDCTARNILKSLTLDEGYLSRIIDSFVKDQVIQKSRSGKDRRAFILTLSPKGKDLVHLLDQKANQSISQLISHLNQEETQELTLAMQTIEKYLTKYTEDDNF